jgi:steroid delta-isomerase-like uncharacterized protein
MPTEDNKTLARRFMEETDKGNLDVIDELIAKDSVDHTPMPGQPPGAEGVKWVFRTLKGGFPDMKGTIQDIVAEGDRVAVRRRTRGTHTGEFMGIPPTGKTVDVEEIHIMRVKNGKFTEHWGIMDAPSMMMQLGVMPAPPGAGNAPPA